VAAKRHRVMADEMHIMSEILNYLIDDLDIKCVKMHLLNHFSYHIRQLGNSSNRSCELHTQAMMALKQW